MLAPIPGMSLTKEPGNAPYEQPPLYNTAEEALSFYFEKFNNNDTLDDILFALESGYPVDAFVDFMTSYSVMEGYHSIDVKMMISPLLHEYLVSLCEAADIKFVEELGPSKEEKIKERDKKRAQALITKDLEEASPHEEGETPAQEDTEAVMAEEGLPEDAPLIPRRA